MTLSSLEPTTVRILVSLILFTAHAFAVDPPVAPVEAVLGTLERKLVADPVLIWVHPDGRFASIVTRRDQLSTWNLQTGQRVSEEAMALPKHTGIYPESICTDGRHIFAWLNYHGLVRYDIRTKAVKTFMKGPTIPIINGQTVVVTQSQAHLAISADGRTLFVKHERDWSDNVIDYQLTAWDCKDGELKERYSIELAFGQEIALSPDGEWIGYVAAAQSTTTPDKWTAWEVQLLDARTGKTVRSFAHSEDSLALDGFTADGEKLLTHGSWGDSSVWDTLTGKLVQTWKDPRAGGRLFNTPDGARVLVDRKGKNGSRYHLLDVKTGRSVREFAETAEPLGLVSFTPDGTAMVTANRDRTVRMWDVATGRERFPVVGHAGDVRAVEWLPDGTGIVSGGHDGTLRVWDVASQSEKSTLPASGFNGKEFFGYITALAVSPDGRRVASAAGKIGVRIWDRVANRVVDISSADLPPQMNPVGDHDPWVGQIAFLNNTSLRISDNDFRVLSLSIEAKQNGPLLTMPYRIKRKDFGLLRRPPVIDLRRGLGVSVYFDFDKSHADDELHIWDFAKQKFRSDGKWPGRNRLVPVALDPTGRRIVLEEVRLAGSVMTVFQIDPCHEVGGFRFPSGVTYVWTPVFSPDGRQCAVQTSVKESDAILIYDMATLSPIAVVNDSTLNTKAFSPDGRLLAVGRDDSRIFVYDLRTALDPTPVAFDATACWADLASTDAVKAMRAVYRFADHPAEAVKIFRERLKPAVKPPAADVDRWIKALDAPAFADRQTALKNLQAVAGMVKSELSLAATKNPSPQTVQTLDSLRELIARLPSRPEGKYLREYRVVQTLEIIGPQAADALKAYAAGAKGAFLTQEAETACNRMWP